MEIVSEDIEEIIETCVNATVVCIQDICDNVFQGQVSKEECYGSVRQSLETIASHRSIHPPSTLLEKKILQRVAEHFAFVTSVKDGDK